MTRRAATAALVLGAVVATLGLCLAAAAGARWAAGDVDAGPDVLARTSTLRGGTVQVERDTGGVLSVYVLVDPATAPVGVAPDAHRRDVVGSVRCSVDRPDEPASTLRGDPDGADSGDDPAALVGSFSAGRGTVTVTCTADGVEADLPIILGRGRPTSSRGEVGDVAVGAAAAVGGLVLAAWGAVRRRRPDPLP